jgi:hypothetical protein
MCTELCTHFDSCGLFDNGGSVDFCIDEDCPSMLSGYESFSGACDAAVHAFQDCVAATTCEELTALQEQISSTAGGFTDPELVDGNACKAEFEAMWSCAPKNPYGPCPRDIMQTPRMICSVGGDGQCFDSFSATGVDGRGSVCLEPCGDGCPAVEGGTSVCDDFTCKLECTTGADCPVDMVCACSDLGFPCDGDTSFCVWPY